MDADARFAPGDSFCAQVLFVAAGKIVHFHRAGQCTMAMVGLRQRRGKHDCHGIADNAVERAFVTEGDGDHLVQVAVEKLDGDGRLGVFHQAGKTFEVGEYEAAFALAAAQRH